MKNFLIILLIGVLVLVIGSIFSFKFLKNFQLENYKNKISKETQYKTKEQEGSKEDKKIWKKETKEGKNQKAQEQEKDEIKEEEIKKNVEILEEKEKENIQSESGVEVVFDYVEKPETYSYIGKVQKIDLNNKKIYLKVMPGRNNVKEEISVIVDYDDNTLIKKIYTPIIYKSGDPYAYKVFVISASEISPQDEIMVISKDNIKGKKEFNVYEIRKYVYYK